MSGGSEAVGDLVQGALIARAVEPGQGEARDDGHTHETACLNCSTPLVGPHCHGCGQAAHVHRTIGGFLHDLVHGVFHFEGKIWRTLPMLAWQPGRLTREYIDGRRASYVSPIALFLFVVFLTFAVFNALGSPIAFKGANGKGVEQGLAEGRKQAEAELRQREAKLAEAQRQGNARVTELEREVKAARDQLEIVSAAADAKLPDRLVQTDVKDSSGLVDAINRGWSHARANPELLVYKLQSNAYKFSWLLIPLSVPFLWLLFPFSRRFHLYDHTVFVTYSLSFMLLLLALVSVLSVWGRMGWIIPLLLLYAPYHMYRQLRGAYALSRFSAWWRTWVLSLIAVVVLLLFALGLTTLSAI